MNLNPTKKELKKFGVVFAVILLAIGLINLHKGRLNVLFYLGGSSLFIFSLAALYPLSIKPFYFIITGIGRMIGWLNTKVILTLIYCLFFTPLAVILKLARRNFLQGGFDKSRKSYWLAKETTSTGTDSYTRQH